MSTKPSAVAKLLRDAGVTPRARKADVATVTLREAERITGVSRQTFSLWLSPLPPEGRKYNLVALDKVAAGLHINRRALGLAALKDAGGHVVSDADDLERIYDYLSQRTDTERQQILRWLVERMTDSNNDAE